MTSDNHTPETDLDTPSLAQQSLDAQAALLPQALGVFAVSLPIYVWAASFARDAVWMSATFGCFAINWAAFYFAVQALKRPETRVTARRARIHLLTGLLWSATVWQVAALADAAGPARETLLMLTTAAAVVCLFFTAPSLPQLLIVGPAAMLGPLAAMVLRPASPTLAQAAWGAFALAFMLSLILNRNLRRQFALSAEREKLAAERTASLAEAERLARSKSALVATLSHEIKNGLTGVAHVLAAAAGHSGRAAPSREQCAAALAAVDDLIAALNATIDAETEEGRLSVGAAPFDPAPMLRELIEHLRPLAASKGLTLQAFVSPELEGGSAGAVRADAYRVRQTVERLLSNAVKYTVRGRVEARLERAGESRIAISVVDTGPGLSPDELQAAFEPFRRIERTAAGTPGAGLGLSLSRRLAELMGARLKADSAPGVGSRFTLELPYDPTAHAHAAGVSETDRPSEVSLRALLAEEDALNAAMLRAILEQLGHQVVSAHDGRRAVDLARQVGFDLVVVAGRAPALGGPEAIRAIRALAGPQAEIPIVATVAGDAADAAACRAAGADAVTRKPATVASVARAIAEALAGRREAAAKAAAA
jgi:signal transduction histidine kinase/CheY-like chemotaxis protein